MWDWDICDTLGLGVLLSVRQCLSYARMGVFKQEKGFPMLLYERSKRLKSWSVAVLHVETDIAIRGRRSLSS